MNWKLRLLNKPVLIALIGALFTFIYQICEVLNIMPPVAHDQVLQIAGVLINVLVLLGIVVDPTTAGIKDSDRAMHYVKPLEEKTHK